MTPQLKAVVAVMATAYTSLDPMARKFPVDAVEVHEELKAADPDSVTAYCLGLLAKYNPLPKPKAE